MSRITYNKMKRVNKRKELVAIKLNYSLNSKEMSDDFLDNMLDHAIIVKRELDKGLRNIIFDPKYIKVEKI